MPRNGAVPWVRRRVRWVSRPNDNHLSMSENLRVLLPNRTVGLATLGSSRPFKLADLFDLASRAS